MVKTKLIIVNMVVGGSLGGVTEGWLSLICRSEEVLEVKTARGKRASSGK